MYQYSATVLKVTDGDTIHARLDLGCDVRVDLTLRLAHINAPEISTNDGKLAKAFVEDWLEVRPVILVETIKDRREKYGRYLAVIYDPTNTGKSLNTLLVEKGMAVPYEGGAR